MYEVEVSVEQYDKAFSIMNSSGNGSVDYVLTNANCAALANSAFSAATRVSFKNFVPDTLYQEIHRINQQERYFKAVE